MRNNRKVPGGRVSQEEAEHINYVFNVEVAAFDFQYQCQDCLHDNPEDEVCSMKYPRGSIGQGGHRVRGEAGELLFCKYFELN